MFQTPEQAARQLIDDQLTKCGWILQDYLAVNLSAGRGFALREVPLERGCCDYLLIVDRKPVGVIEAKKKGTTLSTIADGASRAEKIRIVTEMERRVTLVEAVEWVVSPNRQRATQLRQSILHKAFTSALCSNAQAQHHAEEHAR